MALLASAIVGFDGRSLEHTSRYLLQAPLAQGGMATVHLARLVADEGFARTVAIKRLHAAFARDPHFVRMFLDEARVAARIQHPNIVDTLDVVARDGELFVVMDYIHGESLSGLLIACQQRKVRLPVKVVVSLIAGVLRGLHAAHEATNEKGEKLELIHRDISPQNVFVGVDGYARIIDFGVAKAMGRTQATREGEVKGKLSYMSPEQMLATPLDRRADLFAVGIVLWECLTGQRLFMADDAVRTMGLVMNSTIAPPSTLVPNLPHGLDLVVLKALEREPEGRYQTGHEMLAALEGALASAPSQEVGRVVEALAKDTLAARASLIRSLEDSTLPQTPIALPEASGPAVLVVGTLPAPPEVAPPARQKRWVLPLVAALIAGLAFVAGRLSMPAAPAASDPQAPVKLVAPEAPTDVRPEARADPSPASPPPERQRP